MNLYRLALKNIAGSAFRSWVVALCALLVAGLALGTTLIMVTHDSEMGGRATRQLRMMDGRLDRDHNTNDHGPA